MTAEQAVRVADIREDLIRYRCFTLPVIADGYASETGAALLERAEAVLAEVGDEDDTMVEDVRSDVRWLRAQLTRTWEVAA